MRRREFFKGLASLRWSCLLPPTHRSELDPSPFSAPTPLGDPETQARIKAFLGHAGIGLDRGTHDPIDIRWDTSTVDGARKVTAELIALSPDVILAAGVTGLAALQTRHDIPIVFSIAPIRSALGLSIVWLSLAAT